MLLMICMSRAIVIVKNAVRASNLPVSNRARLNAAMTGATATPHVFGRVKAIQAFRLPGLTSSTPVIRAPP